MKRLILLLVVLYSINCNFEDCVNEKNIADCSSHDVKELGNFNCHAFRSNFSDDLLKDCEIYPDSAEDQKVFWKIYQGAAKESTPLLIPLSLLSDRKIPAPEKEYYEPNEIINVKGTSLSSDDKRIISSNNTCLLKFWRDQNITDRNECFNTNQFSDFENLINCGYATVVFTFHGKQITLKSCYFIPDNHMPDYFEKLFKFIFMDFQLNALLSYYPYYYPYKEQDKIELEEHLSSFKSNLKKGIKRLEDTPDQKYEIIVEDKYGKKYKYTDKSDEPEIIEEGMQGDKIYGANNINDVNLSQTNRINYIFLLFMISLILI